MATTPNKGYELIVTGTQVDTWGDVLNSDVFTVIDSNLGGSVTKSLTNVQVNLNADESENLRLILNGTLTGNVLVTTLCVGMTIVENLTTGNFTVSFQKNGVGTPVVLPQGTRNTVVTGATGDAVLVGVDFIAGTRIAFQQTTPPAGWNKDLTVALNNSAMRIVTGTAGSGGTAAFDTTFAARTPTGTVGDTVLSITQIPPHTHGITTGGQNDGTPQRAQRTANVTSFTYQSESIGGGQPHNHGLTMNPMDFAVKYYDFCIGVKA